MIFHYFGFHRFCQMPSASQPTLYRSRVKYRVRGISYHEKAERIDYGDGRRVEAAGYANKMGYIYKLYTRAQIAGMCDSSELKLKATQGLI